MGSNARRRRILIKQIAALVIIALAGVAVWINIAGSGTGRIVRMHFVNPDGKKSPPFHLEVAKTPAEQQLGLMYRKEMAPDHGMIFVFQNDTVHSFWMRNTYLSLDMLFLDASLSVLGILERVPVLNDEPRTIGKKGRYVIELNAGATANAGIVTGSVAVFDEAL